MVYCDGRCYRRICIFDFGHRMQAVVSPVIISYARRGSRSDVPGIAVKVVFGNGKRLPVTAVLAEGASAVGRKKLACRRFVGQPERRLLRIVRLEHVHRGEVPIGGIGVHLSRDDLSVSASDFFYGQRNDIFRYERIDPSSGSVIFRIEGLFGRNGTVAEQTFDAVGRIGVRIIVMVTDLFFKNISFAIFRVLFRLL